MKKLTLLIILAVFTISQSYSQKVRDVLYLKNGSIIYGTIIEVSENQYKIRTSDQSIFVFQLNEVEKYVKESPVYAGRKKEGMGFALEAGFLVGSQDSEYDLPFSFNLMANYTIDTKNIVSAGSGVEFLGQAFTPLFFEYRYQFSDRKTTPYIFFRGGGLVHIAKDEETSDGTYPQYNVPTDYKGGGSMTIGTGISWSREESETYLSFAYRYARTSYTKLSYNQNVETYKNNFNRLEVKFGFKF
jgi:hypothetical protein